MAAIFGSEGTDASVAKPNGDDGRGRIDGGLAGVEVLYVSSVRCWMGAKAESKSTNLQHS